MTSKLVSGRNRGRRMQIPWLPVQSQWEDCFSFSLYCFVLIFSFFFFLSLFTCFVPLLVQEINRQIREFRTFYKNQGCCVVAQRGGGGTFSFWEGFIFTYVLWAIVECGSLSQVQASLLFISDALPWNVRRPELSPWLCCTFVAVGKLIFLSRPQFLL